jgi:hypothetical protein
MATDGYDTETDPSQTVIQVGTIPSQVNQPTNQQSQEEEEDDKGKA